MTTRLHGMFLALAAAAVCSLGATLAAAQQQPQAQPQRPRIEPGQAQPAQPGQAIQQGQQRRTVLRPTQGAENSADNEIATWLILCNEKEVRLAQRAQQQAEDQAVRQFAQTMVQDHNQAIQRLRQFAPDAPSLGGGSAAQERTGAVDANRDNQPAQNQPGQNPAAQNPADRAANPRQPAAEQTAGQGLPMQKVGYELAQRALATCEQELSKKQGEEFDKAFMTGQVFGHLENWNTQQVLRKYASPELQQVIDQSIKTTEQHLAHAREICEQHKQAGDSAERKTARDDNQEKDDQD